MSTEDRKKKFEHILSLNTHESIVLQQLLEKGSTTVRDLLPFMNYPCGPIRDLQRVFGVALVYDWETKEKLLSQLTARNVQRKLNIKDTGSLGVEMKAQNNINYIHTTPGKNDECYTERYAVEPLLEFLEPFRNSIIWCPFDTKESEFVKVLKENNFNVIYSHISDGKNFFTYEPEEWDILISNPPFTGKKEIFERALSFGKPFALLMTLTWLNDSTPMKLFKNKDLQLLMFEKRMTFKGQANKISFSSAYYCWNFLPQQILIRDFTNQNQMKLFEGVQ